MSGRAFSKEFMIDVLYEDSEEAEIISDTIDDTSRWSEHHTLIFKIGDDYFRAYYSRGLTEMQDESPWEYDKMVEVKLVKPVEVTVIQYEEAE